MDPSSNDQEEAHQPAQNIHFDPLQDDNLAELIQEQNAMIRLLINQNESYISEIEQIKSDFAELDQNSEKDISIPLGLEPNASVLLRTMYPDPTAFDHEISSPSPVPNPLCKGKYVHLELLLLPLTPHINASPECRIPILVEIYSAETTPKQIKVNFAGETLIQGQKSGYMTYDNRNRNHFAQLKIKIQEVTSRMQNNWVFFVVRAEYDRIKPLIVENLVILAKERACRRWRNPV